MLDSSQLSHFRERQLLSLMDTCRLLVFSSSQDEYNEPVAVHTETAIDIPCGVEQKQGTEELGDKNVIVSYDAIIRLPITFTCNEKDRIKLTKKYGEAVDPVLYDIASPMQRGPSGIRLLLKKVTL